MFVYLSASGILAEQWFLSGFCSQFKTGQVKTTYRGVGGETQK
jgi:hypothetical protein